MTIKSYTCESCHSIGYSWFIEAPEGLTPEDVEKLVDELINYTDTPTDEQLQEMLEDTFYRQSLDASKIELFKKVTIHVESVHRDIFSQSFNEYKKGE